MHPFVATTFKKKSGACYQRTCYQIDFTVGISNAASNLSIHENFKRDFAVLISLTARIISSLYSRTSVSNYAIRERAAKIPIQLADEKERKPRALAGYPNEHLAAGRFLATCQRWWSKLWCLVKSWLARARESPVSCSEFTMPYDRRLPSLAPSSSVNLNHGIVDFVFADLSSYSPITRIFDTCKKHLLFFVNSGFCVRRFRRSFRNT